MKKLSILLASAALLATASFSQAGPITLHADGTTFTQLKFENFENLINTNNNGFIDTGDQFRGILSVTSIGQIGLPNDLSSQLFTTDLYGTFLITVASGSVSSIPGGSGNLTFTMATGDYINLYTAPSGTYAPNAGVNAVSTINTLQAAGNLWASVTGSDYIFGSNVTGSTRSANQNWIDFTVNNTGYNFNTLLYPSVIGELVSAQFLSQAYFETQLFDNSAGPLITRQWQFRSEDPVYLQATTVPEPGTFALVGLGLLGAGFFARRRNKK